MSTVQSAREAAPNFGHLCRFLAAAKGDRELALALAERTNANEAVKIVLRSGVPASVIADVYDAAAAPYQMLAKAFLASLVNAGAFDRIANDAVPLPFLQRLGVGTGVMEATVVDEGRPVPMQGLQLSDLGDGMVPLKVVALTALSAELAKVASTAQVIERELRSGVALGTDRKFLADMVAATTPIASTSMLADFVALLDALTMRAGARPYFVFEPDAVKAMATARGDGGIKLFPDLDVTGGSIDGASVIPCDGLASGVALCIDAIQLGVNRGAVGLAVSQQGDVELQSAPTQDPATSTGTTLVSMWSSGLVGVKAQRTFAYKLMRDGAVASLSGVNY